MPPPNLNQRLSCIGFSPNICLPRRLLSWSRRWQSVATGTSLPGLAIAFVVAVAFVFSSIRHSAVLHCCFSCSF
ncbi:unknown protein [Desulfotalea psychrophila LSv54]|uniref:Uncharacterized protein n=1 Tax=Desulfotalea psychrophila (strain LSv54 / DSM 12343) TaxID=177439 RepID=Q6APX4_DESPS|nr:unknown protein [Desulfotalea psychrophila LSv54]